MALHANYGAVLVLRQSMVQEMINISYHNGKIPKRLPENSLPGMMSSFFLDIPKVEFLKNDSRFIFIDLKFWGPLTMNIFNISVKVGVMFTIRERIALEACLKDTESGTELAFSLDADHAFLNSVNFNVYAGGAYIQIATDLLKAIVDNGTTESQLQQAIVSSLKESGNNMLPGIPINYLGSFINKTNASVTVRPMDGLLALGFDLKINDEWTMGHPDELADITGGFEVGYCVNPDAVDLIFSNSKEKVRTVVEVEQGAVLNYLNVSLQEGSFHVAGKATKSPGTATFSLDFIPHLIRPGVHVEWDDDCDGHVSYTTPSREELWLEAQNVNVDLEADWWVRALEALGGILSFGMVTMFVELLFDTFRNNIVSGIRREGVQPLGNRVQEFTLPGTSAPMVRMKLENFQIHTDGMHSVFSIKPQSSISKVSMSGPEFIPIEDLAKAGIKYTVKFPYGISVEDPELKIRWVVRRISDNTILLSTDKPAVFNISIQLDDIKQEFYNASRFMVECRVYRTLGADITDLFNGYLILNISDRLDREKPYVRWSHYVWEPVIRVEQDGSHTLLGHELQYRVSDIHRTTYPGRCLMASRYSIEMPNIPPTERLQPTGLTYMDELPFPKQDLIKNRHLVCDYCFFGGPDKDTPIE